MQLLTVARRAGLGDRIQRRRQSMLKQFSTARSYLDAVGAQVRLSGPELIFHRSTFITGLVGIAEAYIIDSTVEFLVCFPGHLSSKTFDLKALATAGSALHTIRGMGERVVNKQAYQPFPDMVSGCLNFFAAASVIDRSLLEAVNEVKCTRDLFVHNSGRVNSTYRRKVGKLARGDVGDSLDVSQSYVENAVTLLDRFLDEFCRLGPGLFADRGKTIAFREMWEATHLNSLVPFDDAWKIENAEMVRPKKIDWPWSSSEKALYDFFLGIYSPSHPDRTTDAIEAFLRWPPPYVESRVVASWIDSPFTF